MKNLKEAERAAANEENSDVEAHLTISRQDVYEKVKKGSILNDKRAVRNCKEIPVNGLNGRISENEFKESSTRREKKKLRRSPRSPVKESEESSSKRMRSVRGNNLNGDTVSPDVRRRPVRCRK